ncbi:MAG: hypothetical protein ACETVZ_00115 [Phycisphaerae bacterium]
MSTNLTGRTSVVIDLKNIKALDLNEVLDELGIDSGIKWTFGTGANQANILFHDKRTIAQSASETLDLYASGSLKDAFGDALTMAAIKFLYIKNTSADLTVSVFGGGSLDLLIMGGTTDSEQLPPGSFMMWACPTAAGIVTTVNKNLKLAVSAGTGSAIIEVVALGLD